MNPQYLQLIEKISRIVRDRGDVELLILLDRIIDHETEEERAAALSSVVKAINAQRRGNAT